MACSAGPDVSESGLVLALDAGDRYSFTLTEVEVLVVAGGGGGGTHHGGAGGAGGLIYNSNVSVTPGSAVTVTVGGGGGGGTYSPNANGGNGGNSVFGALTAIGGGGGGTYSNNGNNGGSGGGANNWSVSATGGSATSGQGFAGGSNNGSTNYGGGGGGAGGTAGGLSNNSGGPGLYFAQFSSVGGSPAGWFAGGGGAGVYPGYANDTSYGYGGVGGGGNGGNGPHSGGTVPTAGGTNTGGGGGGVADLNQNGAGGGSGIVIVRYPGPQRAIGGTVTFSGGHTIHTFTTVGSTTFTPLSASNGNTILGLSDLSNTGNFGTTQNSPTYSSANGGSVSFDGSNDHISVAYNATLKPTSAITMESFCYIQNNGESWASLIQYPQNSSSHTDPYFDWAIYLNMSSRVLHTRIDGEGVSSSSNVWNFNEWTYVAITFENQSVKYYVNGASVGSSSVTKTSIVYAANNPVFIGRNASGGESFEGRIGTIKVYNKALTAAEISQNFNSLRGRFGI